MKIKSLLMAVVAGAALLVSCEQKEELGPAKLTLDPAALNFEAEGGSQNVELLATRTWQVDSKPDWVRLGTENGEASSSKQTVSVSVEANTGNDRTGSVVFTIGMMKSSLSVTQKGAQGQYVVEEGDGSQDKPFSVAQAADAVKNLTWTSNTEYDKVGPYYVKGKVSSIKENYSSEFGNAQFNISDDGTTAGAQFTAYRVKFLGNTGWKDGDAQVAVGDIVVIYGEIMNYKGNTPETVSNSAYLYSLNGETGGEPGPGPDEGEPEGDGSLDNPFNVAAARAAVKDLTWTSNTDYQKVGPFYVKGKICKIANNGTYGESGTYGNATFYISDDGNQGNDFQCYRVLYLGNQKYTSGTDIKVGDEVIIYAELMNYRGNTPETVSNSGYLYSLNGETGGEPVPGPDPEEGQPEGDGSLDNPFNVAAARAAVKDLTWTSNTDYQKVGPYYVKGKISKIANKGTYAESGEYGNATFDIVDEGFEASFAAYRILYLGNQKYTSGTDIKVGDEVIIYAELMNYRGNTPETVSNGGYLYSLNGETDGGEIEPEIGTITILALRQTEEGFYASWGEYPDTDYYYWELAYADPTAEGGYGLAASGYIDTGHELNAIAGQFDEDETVENAQFWEIDALEDGVEYFFAVYAAQIDPDEEAETDILLASSDIQNPPSFVAGGGEPGPGPGPEPGGDTVTISVDFTSEISGFPQENGTKDGTYTFDGYEFKFHASDNFKQFKYNGATALLIGKKDSYIELPAISGYALSTVEFKTGAGASEKVTVDIAKADGTLLNVNTAALKKDTVYTWTVAGEAGAKNRIAVTNANNAQFQYITLTYSK